MVSEKLFDERNVRCDAAKFYTAYEFREDLMAEFGIPKKSIQKV
jgi:hypothetical protein